MNIEITDITLLKKTIQILSCVIYGHDIRALLRNETKFLSHQTKADLLAIYLKKEDGYKVDFLSDKKRLFCKLMEKYDFNKKSPSFDKVGDDIIKNFNISNLSQEIDDLYTFLKGTVTKSKCRQMHEEIRFKTAILVPLELNNGKKIGFMAFFYTRDKEPELTKLKEVGQMVQRVIEPLYDQRTATFYSKCAQVDSDMSRLSAKEKEIVHRVIKGVSYKEIAEELKISINTLKSHMKNVFSKYGVNSKLELNNKLLVHQK